MPTPDETYKIVVIGGDHRAGKTSLIKRFAKDTFSSSEDTTSGISRSTKDISIDNKTITLELFDIAEKMHIHERDSVALIMGSHTQAVSSFLANAKACIFVFDVTNKAYSRKIKKRIEEVNDYFKDQSDKPQFFLVITKIDLVEDSKKIPDAQVRKFAKYHHLNLSIHYPTSAKDGKNVNEFFQDVAKRVLHPTQVLLQEEGQSSSTDSVVTKKTQLLQEEGQSSDTALVVTKKLPQQNSNYFFSFLSCFSSVFCYPFNNKAKSGDELGVSDEQRLQKDSESSSYQNKK